LPIAGTGQSNRINTALQTGGPDNLIRTLDENFGIPIHHYVQVNFVGFRELVRVLGGVPMYFPHTSRDRTLGLYIEVPEGGGCVTLDPDQALDFVRSRRAYSELVGGDWQVDPTADLGRIRRQQLFMRLALGRALDQGLRDPRAMQDILEVGQQYVIIDDQLSIGMLVDLGSRLRTIEPDRLITHNLPVRIGNAGAASVVFLEEAEAEPELQWFRDADGATSAGPTIGSGQPRGRHQVQPTPTTSTTLPPIPPTTVPPIPPTPLAPVSPPPTTPTPPTPPTTEAIGLAPEQEVDC
jgi:LCP family protein required for cell wall assembly